MGTVSVNLPYGANRATKILDFHMIFHRFRPSAKKLNSGKSGEISSQAQHAPGISVLYMMFMWHHSQCL
jgi:hypothetical protein